MKVFLLEEGQSCLKVINIGFWFFCFFFLNIALPLWVTLSPHFLSFLSASPSLLLSVEWPGFSCSTERPSGSEPTSQTHSSF